MSEQRVSDSDLLNWKLATSEFVQKIAFDLLDARRERDERNAWLAECYRLSGADPDGNEDWRLAPDAVAAVGEQRADYDDACTEIFQLTRRAEKAERELAGARKALVWAVECVSMENIPEWAHLAVAAARAAEEAHDGE